jgi:hypothetical protein
MKFSVSVHYLPNGITHSTQIGHMALSKECAGQVRFGHGSMIFGREMPLSL